MTVYFHGNFGLNREYMAGILAAYVANPKANADQVAKLFGYKAPFTARYKSWLNKTGLVEDDRAFRLTPLGEVIWNRDPSLSSLTTQWFLHHELIDPIQTGVIHMAARVLGAQVPLHSVQPVQFSFEAGEQ